MLRLLLGTGAVGALMLTASAAHAHTARPAQPVIVPCGEAELVNAANAANATGGGNLILAPFCTYTLTSAHSSGGAGGPAGLPNITTPITMTGLTTEITRAPNAPAFRVIEVDGPSQLPADNGQLTLTAVTVGNGDAGIGVGGGIANLGGSLTVTAGGVRGSRAAFGGGIYTDTALTMTASSVTGNTATSAGGGIFRDAGSVTLLATNVVGNTPDMFGSGLAVTSAVHFGSAAAGNVLVGADSQLTATAPPGTGTVLVTATTPGGTSTVGLGNAYYVYLAPPVINSLSPAQGSVSGGDDVLIKGSNLTYTDAVFFGTASASFAAVSDTMVVATSPAGAVGAVTVTVHSPGGTSNGAAFRYQP